MWRRLFKVGSLCREQVRWVLGNGEISVWYDSWVLSTPLVEMCDPGVVSSTLKVKDLWLDDHWNEEGLWILAEEAGLPDRVIDKILQITFDGRSRDVGRWKLTGNRDFSLASAWNLVRDRGERRLIHSLVWGICIGPSISLFLWRLLSNRIPVDMKMQWRGITLSSKCRCCEKSLVELRLHLFVNGEATRRVWNHFAEWFPQVPPFERNENVHRDKAFDVANVIKRVNVKLRHLVVAKLLGPEHWKYCSPKLDEMVSRDPKLPQRAGGGGVLRDSEGEILAAFAADLDVGSGLEAEAMALMIGVRLAKQHSNRIWIESDSETVVRWLHTGHLGPAEICNVLARVRKELEGCVWRISHIFREGNKVADFLAGLSLQAGAIQYYTRGSSPARVKALCRLEQLGMPNFRF
ncbi:uncharacterized protein LOC121808983 [Salvia splendens]|uniref:uncharacterized protein LOC121808983 n=1 Tax=Salvia splendens TaxID=180675 RepID=UPI001C25C862|nr:uncharacterized protein LOC121808983 [Salvia splendens]